MNISEPFIRRPIATSLLMAGVILLGLLGYFLLPISSLPTVDFPTIQVVTRYPGASPEVMTSAVTTPLESQFDQISGLTSMSSTSSFGVSTITLQFNLNRDIDVAAQDVQAAINVARGFLPNDLPSLPVYNKVNPADTPILTLALTSDSLPIDKVNDFADTLLAQKLSQVSGVGLVTIEGNQKPAVRIQFNPAAMASLGLGPEDLRNAITQANVDAPKGSFNGTRQSYMIGSNDQLLTADAYRPLIIAYRNGAPVKLSDIANVIDSVEDEQLAAWVGNKPAVLVDIQRQPGANIIQTVDRIKQLLPKLTASIPPAVKVSILTDRTQTIRASVHDVQFTLVLTVVLVILVIFIFLRRVWATVIPSVALPLSLIGTFGIMYLAGFSLNNLSLMALTISTGFRRGRRHRDDREHFPLHRGRRIASGSGSEGFSPNRVHRHFAQFFADRRFYSVAFHDRNCRSAVPGVCHHPQRGGDRFGDRFVDAHPDDVRQIPEADRPHQAG